MTTLNDLNGYLDDEAYTVRVGELRALLSACIADTAGANPVTGPWPTDAMNAAGMRELAAFHKSRGDTVDAIYLAMSAAAPPAPSVADTGYAFRSDGKLWVTQSLAVAERWKAQGFEITPVAAYAPSVADAAGASEIRALIADDAYAMSFQTMGQYRSALLNAIKKETGK